MAHLKVKETKTDPSARKTWKFSLVKRLYERGYIGSLPQPLHERIHQLSIEQLNALALAIFDLTSIEDLTNRLDRASSQP
ncbi:MAG: hypothetical protein B0A82_02500 [Alkalinema sp. CACIAM 70d]|nr:MAG: hypothetical protein B0A82_02500 [Alkalinema sp. CACIAM 70d]